MRFMFPAHTFVISCIDDDNPEICGGSICKPCACMSGQGVASSDSVLRQDTLTSSSHDSSGCDAEPKVPSGLHKKLEKLKAICGHAGIKYDPPLLATGRASGALSDGEIAAAYRFRPSGVSRDPALSSQNLSEFVQGEQERRGASCGTARAAR